MLLKTGGGAVGNITPSFHFLTGTNSISKTRSCNIHLVQAPPYIWVVLCQISKLSNMGMWAVNEWYIRPTHPPQPSLSL